jgi:hypothetical protein
MGESHGDEVVWAGWAVGRSFVVFRKIENRYEMIEFQDTLVL